MGYGERIFGLDALRRIVSRHDAGVPMDRYEFWADFINSQAIKSVTEIGVWRGEFAEQMLSRCPSIERYYLVDPWQHLPDWNKPYNRANDEFEEVLAEARRRTGAYASKCIFLRGRTTEVELADVDFTYVDGDHTLRGISIDLIRAWPKTKWLGGDDFGPVWQHGDGFEPSMVNPFAAHFAEAVGASFQLYGDQFLISRDNTFAYEGDTRLLPHVRPRSRFWRKRP